MKYEIRCCFSPCYIDEILYSEPVGMRTIAEMVNWQTLDEEKHPVGSENDYFYQYRVNGGDWQSFDEIEADPDEAMRQAGEKAYRLKVEDEWPSGHVYSFITECWSREIAEYLRDLTIQSYEGKSYGGVTIRCYLLEDGKVIERKEVRC